jgi:predicted MFS family arabinose efflux permease
VTVREPGRPVGVLVAAWFLVDFDLAVVNPLLVPASQSLHVGLRSVALALTAYLLLFGLMQPVYGLISDAVGRVRVLRTAMLAWGAANLIATLAPDVTVLIVGRALAGGCAAAVVPVTAAYVGDRFPMDRMQRTMALLLSASAVGAATATIVAGTLAELASWRYAIVVVALAAPVLSWWCRRLPEDRRSGGPGISARSRLRTALAPRWLRFLLIFLLIDGAAMLGFYNFFNASLQLHGASVLTAGLVTSVYGLAAIGGGLLVRFRLDAMAPPLSFALAALVLTAGYAVAALQQTRVTILVASLCAGVALSVGQSTMQTWVLRVAPAEVRGTATSLVACTVFTGAAAGTAAVGGLAGAGEFRTLFLCAAAVSLFVAVVGTLALRRYQLNP